MNVLFLSRKQRTLFLATQGDDHIDFIHFDFKHRLGPQSFVVVPRFTQDAPDLGAHVGGFGSGRPNVEQVTQTYCTYLIPEMTPSPPLSTRSHLQG